MNNPGGVIGLSGAVGMPLPDRIVNEVARQASFLHHDVKPFLGREEMPPAVLHHWSGCCGWPSRCSAMTGSRRRFA
jgi:hypothetical protein